MGVGEEGEHCSWNFNHSNFNLRKTKSSDSSTSSVCLGFDIFEIFMKGERHLKY